MADLTWAEYFEALTVLLPADWDVAGRVGVTDSTVSRWRSGQIMPTPRQAVTVARELGGNALEALVAAGFLRPEEVSFPPAHASGSIRDFPTVELTRELHRRARSEVDE